MRRWRQPMIVLYATVAGVLGTAAYQIWRIYRIDADTAALQANYSLVETGFYIGGFQTKPPDAAAILNLSRYKDDYSADVYQWQPIDDGSPAPSLDWLREQVKFIDAQRRAGRTVFVHCDAGVSRSAMVSAAYFMWRDHLTRERALAYLRVARPRVFPNKAFMELLARWEEAIRAGESGL
ncbi:MAG TPA: dual specificity protein phosphatase [Phycisphaerae bacterium]|nr:dual specificity protein phosphatase [Phycisphaerae bacterium]